MSTKKSLKTAVEREGINYLRTLVEGANCIFHEIHRENDFGNDAIIEFVENEQVKGVCIAVQVKSGSSYCTATTCSIPADKAHFEYWQGHSLPVIGVVYDPKETAAYWTSITGHLKDNPQAIYRGPYTISFEKSELNRLDRYAVGAIFVPRILRRPFVLEYDQSREWANSDEFDKHSVGLVSLLYRHRDKLETWDLFLDLLRKREPSNTNPSLVYFLALIPGHEDIFWSSSNRITAEVKIYVRAKLSALILTDVKRLLAFIDEHGIDRGTVGQNVVAIIDIVTERRRILQEIALDQNLAVDLRIRAVMASFQVDRQGVALLLSKLLDSDVEMRKFAQQTIRGLGSASLFMGE